jgi:hypothetical protein
MKRVFIVHGWGGFPEEAWFPWLKQKLEEKGIEAFVPAMPDTEKPQISQWVSFLAEQIGQPDQDTYLVGHSIGVQTILRYLQTINQPIGGILAVAGFYTLKDTTYQDASEREIAKPWLETPIDNELVKKNAGQITAIFSDDDPYIDLENVEFFKQRLDAKTVVLSGKGHMGQSEGFKEVPEILNELLRMIE